MAYAKNEADRHATSPALFDTAPPPKARPGKPQIATRTTVIAELSEDSILLKARSAGDREAIKAVWPQILALLADGCPVSAITYRQDVAAGKITT